MALPLFVEGSCLAGNCFIPKNNRVSGSTRQIVKEKKMKVVLGADECGFPLKQAIREALIERGYEVNDTNPDNPVLFHIAAKAVAGAVASGEYDRGIVMCGTGMGVSIIANKHRGVYAALCESVYTARRARVVNKTNVLCMGGMIVGNIMGVDMALAWLEAEYLEGSQGEDRKSLSKDFDALVDFEKIAYDNE